MYKQFSILILFPIVKNNYWNLIRCSINDQSFTKWIGCSMIRSCADFEQRHTHTIKSLFLDDINRIPFRCENSSIANNLFGMALIWHRIRICLHVFNNIQSFWYSTGTQAGAFRQDNNRFWVISCPKANWLAESIHWQEASNLNFFVRVLLSLTTDVRSLFRCYHHVRGIHITTT